MKTRSESFLFGNEMEWENPAPGITRQIMGYDGHIMMVKVKFDKGAIGVFHEHFHCQATYVVSGKFEMRIGDVTKELVAGDGFYTAPDEPHGCLCTEPGILIDVFSPHREDFLKK